MYNELVNDLYERYPDDGNLFELQNPPDDNWNFKDTVKGLLKDRDLRDENNAELEVRYGNEIAGDPGLQTYDQLADYYKNLSMVLHDGEEPNMRGLDNYEKLKIATYELMQKRTDYLEKSEHERLLEEKDDSHTDNPGEEGAEYVDDPVLDTDEYYGYGDYFGWK